jgi:cytochrome P450
VTHVPTLHVDDIDLSDMAFWAQPWRERERAFAVLRAERPLARFDEPDLSVSSSLAPPRGRGYRAVTRHADVVEVSRHPELYCSGKGAISIIDLPEEMVEFFAGMISTDNPRHARLRRIVWAAFNPRRVKSIEQSIEEVAAKVIDRVAGLGGCDFVTEIAAPLPLEIICDMMGIPSSDYKRIFELTNIILGIGDPEYGSTIEGLMAAGMELSQYAQQLGRQRIDKPTDDITSAMMNAEVEGQRLSEQEFGSFFILLVVAGNETTRNAISHGMKALTDFPDQRRKWQVDFERVTPTAVEEIVRWATPVIHFRRTTTEDTTLSGQPIKAGDKVVMFYSSANRDEAVFPDPYRFDVTRQPNEHVGYGGGGPHFCLGANLARREIGVMFDELFKRLPDIEVSGPPDMLLSAFIHGIKRMPCRFAPAG